MMCNIKYNSNEYNEHTNNSVTTIDTYWGTNLDT